uniref:Leucine rich repeats-containing protein n=1 Tax=Trepomonas sp. PC1 TaxID=1076344 RepID=A0A146KKB2_9EUKA|eukprot:JAP95866.1 Leucine rich repeats-containing protein [Trepomonas sp. PC1]
MGMNSMLKAEYLQHQSGDLVQHNENEIIGKITPQMKYQKVFFQNCTQSQALYNNLKDKRVDALIVPNLEELVQIQTETPPVMKGISLLVGNELKIIGQYYFKDSDIEKVLGDKLEEINDFAFAESKFLFSINLKNVSKIGEQAFSSTNLRYIRNNVIETLNQHQFIYQSEIDQVEMKSLKYLNPYAFASCIIDHFHAPMIEKFVESEKNEDIFDEEDYGKVSINITNFADSLHILKACPIVAEPDYYEIIKLLPESCFQGDTVSKQNSKQFIVGATAVFPDNIKVIQESAFSFENNEIMFAFGHGVLVIKQHSFQQNYRLKKAIFPVVTEIQANAFAYDNQLSEVHIPQCKKVERSAFQWCVNLEKIQMQPEVLERHALQNTGIKHLNLPSVKKIENYALRGSKIQTLVVENCTEIDDAFGEPYHQIQIQCPLQEVSECVKVRKVVDKKYQNHQLQQIAEAVNKSSFKLYKHFQKTMHTVE